jgi:sec-independent protein translocase protein TatA
MGPIGMPELIVVLALVLIIFGAGKLPEVMGSMGKGVREFRKAADAPTDDKAAPPAEPEQKAP